MALTSVAKTISGKFSESDIIEKLKPSWDGIDDGEEYEITRFEYDQHDHAIFIEIKVSRKGSF